MTFNIYKQDSFSDDWNDELEEFSDGLLNLFLASPEGKGYSENHAEFGGWSAQLIRLGYIYQEVTLTEMDDNDVKLILLRIFPRKISLLSPDECDDVIPELIAFWKYLKREYELSNCKEVLAFLNALDPLEFKAAMNDPANFGPARSFLQAGLNAGFDMTSNESIQAFQQIYNANLASESPFSLPYLDEPRLSLPSGATYSKKPKDKQKRRKAIAKNSRKQNRKKR